jgi:hypothetical protein
MRWHNWVVLTAGSTGSALRAVRPPNLHITPDVGAISLDLQRQKSSEIDIGELLAVVVAHDEAGVLFLDGPGRREGADYPCVGSLEKGTSRAVPRFFGITQRVPIAVVVVGVTG